MVKVDVIINVYGKPWQTLCTLKSLMTHSGRHIDKIFYIKEKNLLNNEDTDWILKYFNNIKKYVPNRYVFRVCDLNHNVESERLQVRYQYGFEKSNKKFVFITHNDVLYTGDIIGDMLSNIGNAVGIGQIGQCWNCPAKNVCGSEKFYEWSPSYDDILNMKLPHKRTRIEMISKDNPKPLPECRLNEWACLINKEISNKETYPNGDTPLFGQYGLDLGTLWFRSLHLKNYKFINYYKNFIHSYWSESSSGYVTQRNNILYSKSEENAKNFFLENYDNNNLLNT